MKFHNPAAYGPPSFSQAVESQGRLLFISGQVPRPPEGGAAAESAEDQFRQVFDNLGLVLASAGVGFDSLVQMRAYLSDRAHWGAFKSVRAEFLGDHLPAITAVVCELADPGWVAEIYAVARLD